MKRTRKMIAVLLSVLTLLSVISAATPVLAAEVTEVTETESTEAASENAEAAESEETENTETATEETKNEEAEILYEDRSRRDKYTKHFVMDNGLRKAVKFAQPIHYEDNGEWVDIDNTLEFNQETEKYGNKSNSFKVNFDKNFNSEDLFTIENKGYTMSWRYKGNSVRNVLTDGKIEKKSNQTDVFKNYVEKTREKIKYNKFESNCNLEYIVTGTGVKENIILEKYSGKNEFSFEVTTNGLSFIKNDDGSVSVVNQNSAEIFFIPAPFMYDSNNEYSYSVEYLIEEKKDKTAITIVADEEWLKDSNRKYPVTIDPVIETDKTKSAIDTTFISSGDPDVNYDDMRDVYIGIESSKYEKCRTLVKFELPEINDGDMVVGAKLGMWLHSTSFYTEDMPDKQINAHTITSSWNAENVTWKTQPSKDNYISDYTYIKQSDVSGTIYEKVFDITRAVKEWYEGTASNYGIMIKADVEDGSDADVAARGIFWSDKYNDDEDVFPYIEIEYRNNKGIESHWDYSSYGVGAVGAAYVNDYTGNLVYELPILSSISKIMPISIVGYYNNYCANELIRETEAENVRTSIGRGFRLNYQQTVLPSTKYGLSGDNAELYPYVYTDGDGTEHYIQKVTEDGKTVYKDEDGLGLTFTTDFEESGTYKITDKAHNNYYFNSRGNLFRISDNNGNQLNIKFKNASTTDDLPDKSRIDKIIDGAGHTYTFTYAVKSSTGVEMDYVRTITDDAERVVDFDISSGLLTKVKYPDGNVAKLDYEITSDDSSEGRINAVMSNNNYELNFDYTSKKTGRRVKTVKEYGVTANTDGTYSYTKGQVITFDRTLYNTTIMRSCGMDGTHGNDDDIITTVQYDNMGRAISQQMKFGSGAEIGAGSCAYTTSDTDESASGFKNKVSGSGSVGKHVENLLYGGNAEKLSPWAYDTVGTLTATTGATTTSTAYMGLRSLKLNVSEIGTENARCYYRQILTGYSAGDTYTLSAYVKADSLTHFSNAKNSGVFLHLAAYDSSGTKLAGADSQIITSKTEREVNNGWRRLTVTMTLPENIANLRLYLLQRNCKGASYFDCIQLEKGSTANDYNMLENSAFSDSSSNAPDSWENRGTFTVSTGSTVSDGVTTAKDIKGETTNVLKVTGEPGESKGMGQTINVQSNPDDTYILSGWAKGYPVNSTFHTSGSGDNITYNAKFEIAVRVTYTKKDAEGNESTVTQYKAPAKFNTTITDWQCASTPIVLKYTDGDEGCTYTPTKILIMPRFNKQENFVCFDKIMLVKDVASSYTYDDEGNLISASSNSEQKSNMEYDDNNNLTSYKDTAGHKSTASYDDNNNMTLTKSAKGSYTRYNYSTQGNVEITETRNASTNDAATAAIRTNNDYNTAKTVDGLTINAGAYQTAYRDQNNKKTTYNLDHETGTLTSVTDAKGVVTNYEYYGTFGLQKSVATRSTKVAYSYNDNQQLNKITFGSRGLPDAEDEYGDTIIAPFEEYSFTYDKFGNVAQTLVGTQPLSTNTYADRNGVLKKTVYGNGDSRRYSYNNFGQKIVDYVTDEGTETKAYSWAYNSSGINIRHTDYVIGIQYLFDYDSLGRISKEEAKDFNTGEYVGSTEYGYDVRNNLTSLITNYGGDTRYQYYYYSEHKKAPNSAKYAKDNLPTYYQLYYNSRYAIYDYDGLNRLTQRKFTLDTPLYYNYIYKSSDRNGTDETKYRTTQISKEFIGNDVFVYSYDVLGNITSIKKATRSGDTENSTSYTGTTDYVTYRYDDLGQLTRELNYSDESVNKYTDFTYDELGNITQRWSYTRNKTDLSEVYDTRIVDYGYGADPDSNEDGNAEAGWNNLLTSVTTTDFDENGDPLPSVTETIDYDEIGNPTTYLGATLTWNGRQLTGYGKDDTVITYTYDSNGLRSSKTVAKIGKTTISGIELPYIIEQTETKYYYVNGQLHYQHSVTTDTNGNQLLETKLHFYYDSNGYLTGIKYNGTNYYVATNKRGDVVALYYYNGKIMGRYEYDAWGNVIKIEDISYDSAGNQVIADLTNNTTSRDILVVNPIRYRSYYYDLETDLYYLQSRYYNAQVGRFLNSDNVTDSGSAILGFNTFIYCANNPVNALDPSGHWIIKNAIKWVAKNIVKPVVKTIQEKLSKVDLTYSTGYNVSGTPSIWTFNGQIGVSVDTKGNVAIQASGGAGATQGDPGISFTRYKSITNTPSINDLNGPGYQLGGSATVPIGGVPVALGGDFNIIPNEERNTTYYGVTTNSGLGFGPSTKEFHVEWGTTITLPQTQFNVFDVAQSVYIKIMEW